MLQVVLGLSAERIAGAFCTAPATMSQRLWRAKTKIRDAGISFEVPGESELAERVGCILEAIYAAYGTSWEDVTLGADGARDLAQEALFLAQLMVEVVPLDAEAKGLLALLQYCEARQSARRTVDGHYVPLSEQDISLWNSELLASAEQCLSEAARLQKLGPWQIEAAIQSAHVARREGRVEQALLVQLYTGLVQLAPSLGARVARASAVGAAWGPDEGLRALEHIHDADNYQPYWAVRAALLKRAGREIEARNCFERAAGLSKDDALRSWLLAQRNRL